MRALAILLGSLAVGIFIVLNWAYLSGNLDPATLDDGDSTREDLVEAVLWIATVLFAGFAVEAWQHDTDDLFTCPRCGQEFATEAEYSEHFGAYHSAEGQRGGT